MSCKPAVALRLPHDPILLSTLPGWPNRLTADPVSFYTACQRSLAGLQHAKIPRVAPFAAAPVSALLATLVQDLASLPADTATVRAWCEQHLLAWPLAPDTPTRMTGYYEPVIDAAEAPSDHFPAPIWRLPPQDTPTPLPVRAAITAGALAGLELAWLPDRIEAFFLEIQGSGVLQLPDGRQRRVNYAGSNGHRYVAIGTALLRSGAIPRAEMSMDAIKRWLYAHPDEADRVMHLNPAQVFFRWVDADGPIGTWGVPLTAGHAVAVDPAHTPLGAPVWLAPTTPTPALPAPLPAPRLVLAQDTGGAIKGPGRIDLYLGTSAAAGRQAGALDTQIHAWMLLPRALGGGSWPHKKEGMGTSPHGLKA